MIHIRRFEQLSLKNFHPQLNVIVGKNAQGKTSILEALSFVAQLASFRTHSINEMLQDGQTQASVKVQLERPSFTEVLISLENGRKNIRVDEQKITSRSKYPFLGSSVSFVPDDLLLVKGSPEARRNLIDELVISLEPQKEQTYRNFQKILKQRNRLLKQIKDGQRGEEQLFIWTDQYIELALQIYSFRQAVIQKLSEKVSECYQKLFNISEKLVLNYKHGYENFPDTKEIIETRLGRLIEAEKAIGYTLVGPHRDDIEFELQKLKARSFASQGQTRSLVIALKIAQLELLQSERSLKPILFLDDIISELDDQRTHSLVNYLANYSGQLFVTTAEVSKLKSLHEQFPDFKLIDLSQAGSEANQDSKPNLSLIN